MRNECQSSAETVESAAKIKTKNECKQRRATNATLLKCL